ncbi:pilus assembly protein PilP [Pseudomonas fragi]|nr:pilus assembly protein PilP [Pseudomonas fragi]
MSVHAHCLVAAALVSLMGCDSPQSIAQLARDLHTAHAHVGSVIDPLPARVQRQPFVYEATLLRSPFHGLHEDQGSHWQASLLDYPQHEARSRGLFEGTELAQFELVGTLSNHQQANALLRAKGVVHRVQPGDYLGRNNGQIAAITPQHVEVFEVISDGRGGWLERTLTISLKQQS